VLPCPRTILAKFGIKIFETKKVIQKRKVEARGAYITSIISMKVIVSITEKRFSFKMGLYLPDMIPHKRMSLVLL
jgi:hypothetical protein